jgi:hypothetical protein
MDMLDDLLIMLAQLRDYRSHRCRKIHQPGCGAVADEGFTSMPSRCFDQQFVELENLLL